MANPKTELFSTTANCYAYAMKVKRPRVVVTRNGTAKPGKATANYAGNLAAYKANLIQGVKDDGGQRVEQLVYAEGTTIMPTLANTDRYMIALLCDATGFHFLRRQRTARFSGQRKWKWKDGNGGLVHKNIYSTQANDYVDITDERFFSLVNHPANFVGWKWPNMRTIAFFAVHKDGITVYC